MSLTLRQPDAEGGTNRAEMVLPLIGRGLPKPAVSKARNPVRAAGFSCQSLDPPRVEPLPGNVGSLAAEPALPPFFVLVNSFPGLLGPRHSQTGSPKYFHEEIFRRHSVRSVVLQPLHKSASGNWGTRTGFSQIMKRKVPRFTYRTHPIVRVHATHPMCSVYDRGPCAGSDSK